MNIFDSQIEALHSALAKNAPPQLYPDTAAPWPVVSQGPFLMEKETALELGGHPRESTNFLAFTTNAGLVPPGEISLYGDGSLFSPGAKHVSFGKAVLVQIGEPEQDTLYQQLKSIEFLEYKLHLRHVMVRSSGEKCLTNLRVGKKAFKENRALPSLGAAYNRCFSQHPLTIRVHTMLFIGGGLPYKEITGMAVRVKTATQALNTILLDKMWDCDACSVKPVCDEMDGLRAYHMAAKNASQ